MWTRRTRIRLAVGLAHLGLVVLGASYFPFYKLGWVGDIFAFYGTLSGAGSNYGFFADDVKSEVRARFAIVDHQGKQSEVRLGSGSSHEADLRVNGITGEFLTDGADALKFQRALAASLAGSVFGQHPEAAQVVVILEEHRPASMEEYRRGERPTWQPLYEVTLTRATPQK